MAINIKVSDQYQGVIETAGSPQSSVVGEAITRVNSLSEIPANANGVYRLPSGELLSYVNGASVASTVPIIAKNVIPSKYKTLKSKLIGTINGDNNTRILFAGDSTTAGSYPAAVSNQASQSYSAKMTNALGKKVIKGGRHGIAGLTSHESSASLLTVNNYDNRFINHPAGWTTFDTGTAFGCSILWNTTTVNPVTFTPDTQTDTIDVYYYSQTGYDPFVVKNGAATIGTAVIDNTGIKKLSCPTTAGVNTYTIQRAGTGTSLMVFAVESYLSTEKEITSINMGFGGGLINTWFSLPPVAAWDNINVLKNAIIKYDLVVINYGINHWANYATQTLRVFTDNLNYVVNDLNNAGIPILLIVPPYSPESVVSSTIQDGYMQAIINCANTYGVAYINFAELFGTNAEAIAQGYMASADVHPYPKGYMNESMAVSDFISSIVNL